MGGYEALGGDGGDNRLKIAITIPTTGKIYVTPFETGQKILELGGGEAPIFRPNMDFRKLPTVDIVADLEKPFPVEDGVYDGVFSNMAIEHIGWRHHSHFAEEVFRVLKPEGVVVVICPNTLEQCRAIAGGGVIGIKENALLYGGQEGNWGETGNYHKSAFSPKYIVKLFADAGFVRGKIEALEDCYWDMVLVAYKEMR